MNWNAISFDWNQIRAFHATVEEGSFSAAARALNTTQPTISRQIDTLEEALDIVLFVRSRRAMKLTQSGTELLDHVRAMGESAMKISLAASGQSQAIEGRVSITATNMLTEYILPQVLLRIREEAPGIIIDLIPSDGVHDLTRREADIAIRHAETKQPDLIARGITPSSVHFYASKTYLEKFNSSLTANELSSADFIGPESPEQYLPVINTQGVKITKDNFKITTTTSSAVIAIIKQGLGISILPSYIAQFEPSLQRVLPNYSIPLPIWLVTHKELRTTRRIRLVFDILLNELKKYSLV